MSATDAPAAGATAARLPDTAPHLLVVDDDQRIRELLRRYLSNEGFRVTVAGNAAEARRHLASLTFDLLIVDVTMPGETGLDFTADLRASSSVPVLILTARSEPESRVRGLELGADDYLAKPFEPRELVLRIQNILRRQGEAAPVPPLEEVRFGPFTFHLGRRELRQEGQVVRLTERERALLFAFAAKAGETVSRYDLVDEGGGTGERTIDVQVNRLRRKIEPDPANPIYLQTVRGIGYRLLVD